MGHVSGHLLPAKPARHAVDRRPVAAIDLGQGVLASVRQGDHQRGVSQGVDFLVTESIAVGAIDAIRAM
jgi:hypothetical protein